MQAPKHLDREEEEQRIIAAAQTYPSLRHDYDDCGAMHALSLETRIIDVEDHLDLHVPDTGRSYVDAFLSLQAIEGRDYRSFFSELDGYLQRRSTRLRKADTVFLASGKPYAFLALTYGQEFDGVGSIDTYVGNEHFLLSQDPSVSGFYAACAAVSDIGADGAELTFLSLHLINAPSPAYRDGFARGVTEASRYCGIKENPCISEEKKEDSPEMVAIFTVAGKLIGRERTALTGLSEGMDIYIAGKVGGAALSDYRPIPREQLEFNLNPAFRRKVIESLSLPSLVNDTSDGVEKSLQNLVRNADKGLFIDVSEDALHNAAYSDTVTLDHIKYGGDDYALVIATHAKLSVDGVVRIGTVRKK